MPLNIRVGGVWKAPTPSIRVGGTWKTPDKVYIRVGGVWKEVWASGPSVTLSGSPYFVSGFDSVAPYNAAAGLEVNASGQLRSYEINGGSPFYTNVTGWLASGNASDVEVRMVKSSGNGILDGLTDGAWYNAGTTRLFRIVRTQIGITDYNGTIEFRNASTLVSLGSQTVNLYVENVDT